MHQKCVKPDGHKRITQCQPLPLDCFRVHSLMSLFISERANMLYRVQTVHLNIVRVWLTMLSIVLALCRCWQGSPPSHGSSSLQVCIPSANQGRCVAYRIYAPTDTTKPGHDESVLPKIGFNFAAAVNMLKAPEALVLSSATQIPFGNPALQRPEIEFTSGASAMLSRYRYDPIFSTYPWHFVPITNSTTAHSAAKDDRIKDLTSKHPRPPQALMHEEGCEWRTEKDTHSRVGCRKRDSRVLQLLSPGDEDGVDSMFSRW